MVWQMLTVDIA